MTKPKDEYPIEFETFRKINSYQIDNLISPEPSCYNGFVNIRRYKVTIESIDEPTDVLADRLQKLWDENDNMHNYKPLMEAAKRIGYTFKTSFVSKRNKTT